MMGVAKKGNYGFPITRQCTAKYLVRVPFTW